MLAAEKIAMVEEYIRLERQIRILGEKAEALEDALGNALGTGSFRYQDYVLFVKNLNGEDHECSDEEDETSPDWFIEIHPITELKKDED